MLREGDTSGINGSFGTPEKKFSINYSKAKTKFRLSLHYNSGNSYLFVKGKKFISLKQITKISTLQMNFVLEAYLINLTISRQKKYLEKKMCMIFQSIKMLLINLTY